MQVSIAVDRVRVGARVGGLFALLCACLASTATAGASTGALGVGRFTTTIGFHTAAAVTGANGVQRIQTAIWASYAEPNVIVELPGILHSTDVLSHEVSEWLHDPFLNNVTPDCESPLPLSAAIYGCDNLLETGDAASDLAFDIGAYQLQDEAFLSWFAQQVPSIGINGQYDYMGAFTQPAPMC
jgi:hypothetical protein